MANFARFVKHNTAVPVFQAIDYGATWCTGACKRKPFKFKRKPRRTCTVPRTGSLVGTETEINEVRLAEIKLEMMKLENSVQSRSELPHHLYFILYISYDGSTWVNFKNHACLDCGFISLDIGYERKG
jgi:hypothetical protein